MDDLSVVKETCFGSKITKKFKQMVGIHPSERLRAYQEALFEHFDSNPPIIGTIVLEEPMGHLVGKSREIVALKGVYLVSLPIIIPYTKIYLPKPTQIKKAFTGNGRADKDELVARCIELGYTPPKLGKHDNDHLADAFAMAWMSVTGALNVT